MLVPCPSCGATNRLPDADVGKQFRCSRCKTLLPSTGTAADPLTVTDATFAALVEQSPVPVLVDFWAPWCGPCHMVAPTIAQLARELGSTVRVGKLNIDENPATADRLGIRSIPTILLFRDGREADRLVGVQPKAEILRRLQTLTARRPHGVR